MVVGTASHVGKSIVVTALCRIMQQDGFRVAPFKSQNMALNSYVCSDGSEIGRAQVVQAEAAGLEPETDMNPILLKPTGDRRIQVVLHGRVYQTMSATAYYEKKSFFFSEALASFHRLASRFDVILLEGAGSAAEINLRERDIVNLPFARAVGAGALLVADIDRGGVFASVAGTFGVLDDDERDIIRGFLINRFRGDIALFKDGPEWLERRTGRPCLGIMPFMESLRIDQEDSVSLEDRTHQTGEFRVGVIRLPHIANYTDFNALETLEGVAVEYLSEAGMPVDLLIIPGTKNTISDLRWLLQRGFNNYIFDTLERRGWVLGICGGYQMLGQKISDPFAVEEGGSLNGLGLLPVETELSREKVTVRSQGRSFLGTPVTGYEIHMGHTVPLESITPMITRDDGTSDGILSGRVAATYFHGLFDNPRFAAEFLSLVAKERGLTWQPSESSLIKENEYNRIKENEYNRLAAAFREHLDVRRIYELMQ
jgi:adenosylcobyric acid synthase